MYSEPTTLEKLRGLPWSIASNAALSFFVQLTFFGSVFVLFLGELGLSKSEIGAILSLLPFTGLLALLVAPAVARFGYKRTYITFFGARTFVTAGLLLTPLVAASFGIQAALVYVAAITLLFALLRSVGVTASFPWTQEYVPNSVRGKYMATNNMFSTTASFIAVTGAGFALSHTTGLAGYMLLIGVGVVFGFVSMALALFIPGGAPQKEDPDGKSNGRDLREASRDRNFLRYLAGIGVFTLATVPLASFLPLFMHEQIGLASAQIVLLQTGSMLGALSSSYLWGWTADRYGSKPVMLYGVALRMLLPILWLLMPRGSAWSLPAALSIAFLQGVADVGWGVGSSRLLYVSVVPPAKRGDYMAFYYAWVGIAGGVSQLLGGQVLQISQGASASLPILGQNPYVPLFLLGLLLPPIAILLLRRMRDDSTVGMSEMAGIFLRGNPLLAVESMIRYYRARDEHETVLVTERMGQAKSLLTVEELLEALADPRFNVRFEALISIGRMGTDERLLDALTGILNGNDPALSTLAAWALGRMGDERAVEPLRAGLDSRYRSVKAHSSRSLASLGDRDMAGLLLDRLASESDYGLQIAYASALGQLRVQEATEPLLALLRNSRDEISRLELALAVARIIGDEHYFIQLLRQARRETGTATAQAVLAIKKRGEKLEADTGGLAAALDACAQALARNELSDGLALLSGAARLVAHDHVEEPHRQILRHCARRLDQFGPERLEYAILALHALHVGWHP